MITKLICEELLSLNSNIKLKDKLKIRDLMKKEPLLFHIMLKQEIMWYTLASGAQETV